MADHRLNNDRLVKERPHGRSVAPLVFLGLLLSCGIAVVILQFNLITQLSRVITGTTPHIAPQDQADTEFTNVYTRYGIKPLDASRASNQKVHAGLLILRNEPCDKHGIFQVSQGLETVGGMRDAARVLQGFGTACPDANGEIYHSAELYYLVGDYDAAIEQANVVAHLQPDYANVFYLRARALQGARRYDTALEDYATTLRLAPDLKRVNAEVFMRMSASYEALGHYCEAMMPVQMYMAVGGEARNTSGLRNTLADLSRKGACAATFARGDTVIPQLPSGVISVKAVVNGVEGNFIIDTGASFVTLSRAFAVKVKATPIGTNAVNLQTANGAVSSPLATATSIRVGGVSADAVPLVVVEKLGPDGVDGLLGMSFLSRFDIAMRGRQIELKAKRGG
ncbi:MAG TPA: aspartyl protease family protein [Acetobacteraceae bacterium]